jgi:hypothetical protein
VAEVGLKTDPALKEILEYAAKISSAPVKTK